MTRDHLAEACERIRVFMEDNSRRTRNEICLKTGCGVPEFNVAVEVFGLVRYKSNSKNVWVIPTSRPKPNRINVMQVPAYVPSNFQPPRANSLAYKAIQSRGIGA